MRESITIGSVGAGGDGVVVMGSLLQKLAAAQGYFSQMPRYYGAQIRGGGSAVKISLDAAHLSLTKDVLDILVCFSWEKYLEFKPELSMGADTVVIYEGDPIDGVNLPQNSFQIDFSRISQDKTGSARNKNIVALGLLNKLLSYPKAGVMKAVESDAELRLLKSNVAALEAGERAFKELSLPDLSLSPARDKSPKIVLQGNEAMARAAIRAGCRAYFGYPITPAAEIMQEIQGHLSAKKGVYIQAEDEIAAAAMTIGASLVGTKSLTGTSGPGLDLMTECIGLASSAEIPMVVIDVQRGGASTGIPSKSEQSDLNHAIYGGHGDAPRVVMAPYDLEGCYRLVIESFNIAEGFQVPVLLLSDQWLGQTSTAVNDEFMKKDYQIIERKKPARQDSGDYLRYQITDDFISPMSVAGDEGAVYQASGLTHKENGRPAFDFKTQQSLHEKRWKKLIPLQQRDELVKVFGNEASTKGIITWGSSALVVLEALKSLGVQDEVKVCVPELIYPLPEMVERFIKATKRLLVIEMNYSGQLHGYLRSQLQLPRNTKLYARAGGRPFSREELAKPIAKMAR